MTRPPAPSPTRIWIARLVSPALLGGALVGVGGSGASVGSRAAVAVAVGAAVEVEVAVGVGLGCSVGGTEEAVAVGGGSSRDPHALPSAMRPESTRVPSRWEARLGLAGLDPTATRWIARLAMLAPIMIASSSSSKQLTHYPPILAVQCHRLMTGVLRHGNKSVWGAAIADYSARRHRRVHRAQPDRQSWDEPAQPRRSWAKAVVRAGLRLGREPPACAPPGTTSPARPSP